MNFKNIIFYLFVLSVGVTTAGCQFKKNEPNGNVAAKNPRKETVTRDTSTGKTIYELAAESNSINLEIFLRNNPELNVNAEGDDERTPLEIAVRAGYSNNVDILLAHGAVPSKITASGLSLMDLAESSIKIQLLLKSQIKQDESKFRELVLQQRYTDGSKKYAERELKNSSLESEFIALLFQDSNTTPENTKLRMEVLSSNLFPLANYLPAIKLLTEKNDFLGLKNTYYKIGKQNLESDNTDLRSFLDSQNIESFLLNVEASSYWTERDSRFTVDQTQRRLQAFPKLNYELQLRFINLIKRLNSSFTIEDRYAENFLQEALSKHFSGKSTPEANATMSLIFEGYLKLDQTFSCSACVATIVKNDPKLASLPAMQIKRLVSLKGLSQNFLAEVSERPLTFTEIEFFAFNLPSQSFKYQKNVLETVAKNRGSEINNFYILARRLGIDDFQDSLFFALRDSLQSRWQNKSSGQVSKKILELMLENHLRLEDGIGISYFSREIEFCAKSQSAEESLLIHLARLLGKLPQFLALDSNKSLNLKLQVTPIYYAYLNSKTPIFDSASNNGLFKQLKELYFDEIKAIRMQNNSEEKEYNLIDALAAASFLDKTQLDKMGLGDASIVDRNLAFQYLKKEYVPSGAYETVFEWLWRQKYLTKALEQDTDLVTLDLLKLSFESLKPDFTNLGKSLPGLIFEKLLNADKANDSKTFDSLVAILKSSLRPTNPRLFISTTQNRMRSYIELVTSSTVSNKSDPLCWFKSSKQKVTIKGLDRSEIQFSNENIAQIKVLCSANVNEIKPLAMAEYIFEQANAKKKNPPNMPASVFEEITFRFKFSKPLQREWLTIIKSLEFFVGRRNSVEEFLSIFPANIRNFDLKFLKEHTQEYESMPNNQEYSFYFE